MLHIRRAVETIIPQVKNSAIIADITGNNGSRRLTPRPTFSIARGLAGHRHVLTAEGF